MSRRLEEKFTELARDSRKGLVTFLMGGDPDIATSGRLLAQLPAAGADILEIGMPFSDPMSDGPAIQAAGLRALHAGVTLKDIIRLVRQCREKDATTPIILMGYFNPIYVYGIEKFCKDATAAGADGVILVDLPPEEEKEFITHAAPHDLKLIRLAAPTTDDTRFTMLLKNAGGFIYYISVAGITGTKSADLKPLEARVKSLKSKTKLPIAVGFGIKTPKQAAEVAAFSDAVVVGSALVEMVGKGANDTMIALVKSLRNALDAA